jgi:hypothetical protein
MNMLTLLGQIFGPATELIDNLHTSAEEKLDAKNQLMAIQANVVTQAIKFETKALNAKRDIIVAEAQSDSWLTRNWRPLTMLALVGSILAFWFGFTPSSPLLTEDVVLTMFGLVKIGVGGYITSRGVEKVAPGIINAFKKREKV